jgi:hypothetical protein
MNINFERLIEIAYALYDPEEHPIRTFHTSFILNKKKILSIGINNPKTHTINLRNPKVGNRGELIYDKGMCSELVAIKKLISKSQIRTEKCSLINLRIDKNNKLNCSKPCSSCEKLLKYYSFDEVFYSSKLGLWKKFT